MMALWRWLRRLLSDTPIGHSPLDPDTGQIPDNPVEQAFARWAWAGARIGFLWVAVAFGLYVTGALPPLVPIPAVEQSFHLSAAELATQQGTPDLWPLITRWGRGDALSLAGLVFTTAVMALAYLATGWVLLRQRDWLFAGLVLLQVAVFAYAAFAR
ncbi:MAG TPA: hypothetical protein VF678_00165 [bacterium]